MPFHPQVERMMRKRRAIGARSISEFEGDQARAAFESNSAPFRRTPTDVAMTDRKIRGRAGTIPVRVYTPPGPGPFPIVVYLHGGGWVVGSIKSADEAASMLAHSAKSVVVSVGYRLAPEHRFPVPLHDCFDALEWAWTSAETIRGDPGRLVVCGDSAGGNLAASVSILAREVGGPKVALQLLVYPMVDASRDMRKYEGTGYGPTPTEFAWFNRNYFVSASDAVNPLISPLLADLHGLPPAAIVLAQYDTLTEQAEDYARKLGDAGVGVASKKFRGMTHGFWGYPGYFDLGREAVEWGASQVRKIR